MTSDKWYKGGLRFACTACGNCCTGAPGHVWVTREEIRRIARYLERDDEWLSPEILRRVGFKYSLTERNNGDCVFLEPARDGRRGCRIYPVRPLQCRTWPFWTINLKSPACWAQTSETCPGMNNNREYSFDEIEGLRLKKDWE